MSTLSTWIVALVSSSALILLLYGLFVAYVLWAYGADICRIFETKPLLLAARMAPVAGGQEVRFRTRSGRELAGSYFRHEGAGPRRGVVLFCPEYSADRWLFEPYVGFLRADGFDLFSFEFCNHGQSQTIEGYQPLQWVTRFEREDVEAALDYLMHRPDAEPAGVGLFGVSKGGGAAIAAAARHPFARVLVTDGAFPTHGTVTEYETHWAEIYVRWRWIYRRLPFSFFAKLTEYVVWRMGRHHGTRYIRLERSIRRLAGRPLFMIHGARDNYIKPIIAQRFFELAGQPKELWVVGGAKHNGCVDAAPGEYRERVRGFFLRHTPAPACGTTEPGSREAGPDAGGQRHAQAPPLAPAPAASS